MTAALITAEQVPALGFIDALDLSYEASDPHVRLAAWIASRRLVPHDHAAAFDPRTDTMHPTPGDAWEAANDALNEAHRALGWHLSLLATHPDHDRAAEVLDTPLGDLLNDSSAGYWQRVVQAQARYDHAAAVMTAYHEAVKA